MPLKEPGSLYAEYAGVTHLALEAMTLFDKVSYLRPAGLVATLLVAQWCLSVPAVADGLPPPAFTIAARLHQESISARDYARVLAATGKSGPDLDSKGLDQNGDAPTDPNTASFQHHVSVLRDLQAVEQYMNIASSATYGHTPYAPSGCYRAALILMDDLRNDDRAMTSLQLITNKYGTVTFPEQQQALALKLQLETAIDLRNKTKFPGRVLYAFMDFLVKLTGARPFSYALAILIIGVGVRISVTPLSNKMYASMKEQQKLQPVIKEIQAKYANDKEQIGKKTMEAYAEHGVNPAAGCLPMLIQLPVFFLLMYMIRLYQYQFVHGTFLWIGSPLSKLYPMYMGTNLGQIDLPLMVIYGFTMYLQQRMMTPPADPQQAEQQRTMAIMSPFITVYFTLQYHLPSAFVLYYIIFNLLSMAQQFWYMKKRKAEEGLTVQSTPSLLLNGKNGLNGNVSTIGVVPPKEIGPKPERADATSNGQTTKVSGAASAPKGNPKKKRR